MALSFFFGKERAKKIEKEEKEEAQNEPIIKYGKTVREQIRAQIQKLQEAHLTFDGWRLLLDDYDITNCISTYPSFMPPVSSIMILFGVFPTLQT